MPKVGGDLSRPITKEPKTLRKVNLVNSHKCLHEWNMDEAQIGDRKVKQDVVNVEKNGF